MTAHLAALGVEPALRDGLIAAHAISAAAAFILGALLLARSGNHPVQSSLYVTALTLMAVFVTGAVILDWRSLSPATRGIFAALLALGAYTVWRGWQARKKLTAAGPSLPGALDDLGFTLITLFTGFVVILADDLGGPVWLVVALGVLAVATGRRLAHLVTARRLRRPDSPEVGSAASARDHRRAGAAISDRR